MTQLTDGLRLALTQLEEMVTSYRTRRPMPQWRQHLVWEDAAREVALAGFVGWSISPALEIYDAEREERTPMTDYIPFVQIKWDNEHLSPPIGPFKSITEAREFATHLRKLAREQGRRISLPRVGFLRSPGTAEAWLRSEEPESHETTHWEFSPVEREAARLQPSTAAFHEER